MPLTLRVFLFVSAMSVLGGVLWRVMQWPPGYLGHIAGAAMILSGAVAAAMPLFRVTNARRTLLAALVASAIGGGAEIAGLYRGLFGNYVYTDQWQPSVTLPGLLSFPVLLPVTWFAVLATCYSYARQRVNTTAAVIVGALLATTVDAVSEALLTGPVGFWFWLGPAPFLGAPLSNSVGWAITSLLGCTWLAVVSRGQQPTGNEPRWILLGALVGVVIIGTTHGEFRSMWALVPAVAVALWQPRATT